MKKHTLVAFGLIAVLGVALLPAANAADATADATAVILGDLTISNIEGLNFGNIAVNGAGTVTVSTAGVRTNTGDVLLVASTDVAAANFLVEGVPNATYAVTLPASATITSGTNSMVVNGFASNPAGGAGTLSGAGQQNLFVGATLNVNSAQVPGTYTGTFDVTVSYN